MTYTSIFEKILVILNIICTSWIYIAFALVALVLLVLLILKKISKKTCFILNALATILVLGYTVYIYYEPISQMMNSIIDNLFLNIYFPSAYAYLFILVFINVVAISSLLNPRSEKVYKTVNGICFIITNFTLTLILERIAKDNIDIFAKESLFANPNLITLLEFGINVFIGWLIALAAIYVINVITERIMIVRENKKLVNEPAITMSTSVVLNNDKLQEEYKGMDDNKVIVPEESQNKFIPSFITANASVQNAVNNKFIPSFNVSTQEVVEQSQNKFIPVIEVPVVNEVEQSNNYKYGYDTNNFDLSSFIPKKQEVRPISVLNDDVISGQIFDQFINNDNLSAKEEFNVLSNVEDPKNTYTLNDYRIFNKMLKDIQEHNESNSVVIDKNLEYRLITKYSTETYNMFKTMLKIYSN